MAKKMRNIKIEERITNRSSSVERYMVELGKLPLINIEKEVELAIRAKTGDRRAIDELVKANLRFVVSVAKQYSTTDPILLEDLIAQGNIGLVYAAETFDYTRGFKFISYAVWHIRKEILQYLNEKHKLVRLPTNFNLDRTRIQKAESVLLTKLDRPANREEIVEEVKSMGYRMTEDRFDFVTSMGSVKVALEKDKNDTDGFSPIEWLNIDSDASELAEFGEKKKIVEQLLSCLSPAEIDIVKKKIGFPHGDPATLQSIASEYKCSSEAIRQIFKRAMRKLRSRAGKLGMVEELID